MNQYEIESGTTSTNEKIGIMALIAVVLIAIVLIIVWWIMDKNKKQNPPPSSQLSVISSSPPSTTAIPSITPGITPINVSKSTDSDDCTSDESSTYTSDSTTLSRESTSSESIQQNHKNDSTASSDNKSSTTRSRESASSNTTSNKKSSTTSGSTNLDKESDSTDSDSTTRSHESSTSDSTSVSHHYGKKRALKRTTVAVTPDTIGSNTTSRHSKTRAETGEIEVYSLAGERQRSIELPNGCSINCMVSDNSNGILYVHLIGTVKQTGLYKLDDNNLTLVVLTKDIVVINMYLSVGALVLSSSGKNYTLANDSTLKARKGATYDKHQTDDNLISLSLHEPGSYKVNINNSEVATLAFPTKVRVYNDNPVYFTSQKGYIHGIDNIKKVTSFDSSGSILAYVKDCTLNIITQDTYTVAEEEVMCEGSMTVILNDKIYVA
jgi:hypothetical protein